MTEALSLAVVDQSPIRSGGTAYDAIEETIQLAQACERWGYHRFWVAEHHGSDGLAGASPELLISRLGAATSSIRVGSGGVMLSHYSPLKVVENFHILQTMYPGRVDLGIGRAPGGDQLTAAALAYGSQIGIEYFATRVADMLAFIEKKTPPTQALARVKAAPYPDVPPEVWLLGSSDQSGIMAAHFGTAFSFAQFINPIDGPKVIADYRRDFKPSSLYAVPQVNVGCFVICAETEEEAQWLASSRELWWLRFMRGELGPYPSPEESKAYPWTEDEKRLVAGRLQHSIVGNPTQVRDGLLALAESHQADELSLLTITHDFQARLRSYELVAEVMGSTAQAA